ncbi:hypothetical protein [Niabella terrae]
MPRIINKTSDHKPMTLVIRPYSKVQDAAGSYASNKLNFDE